MRKLITPFLAVACVFLMGADDSCDGNKSDRQQQLAQELARQQANSQVGMPGITNFTEMKIVRKLYELRDQNIATFTYMPDMQGRLWHVCDSIGYGLPYGVQFSNPEKRVYNGSVSYNLPQSEPNGLYMPPSAEGTWVICASEKTKGDFEPVYVEPRVIVSPFKLQAAGEYLIK
jgi:hypothetical protein